VTPNRSHVRRVIVVDAHRKLTISARSRLTKAEGRRAYPPPGFYSSRSHAYIAMVCTSFPYKSSCLVGKVATPWSVFGKQNRVSLVSFQRAPTLHRVPGATRHPGTRTGSVANSLQVPRPTESHRIRGSGGTRRPVGRGPDHGVSRRGREAGAALCSLTFRVLFVFVVLSHDRRRIVHLNVATHPTSAWTA